MNTHTSQSANRNPTEVFAAVQTLPTHTDLLASLVTPDLINQFNTSAAEELTAVEQHILKQEIPEALARANNLLISVCQAYSHVAQARLAESGTCHDPDAVVRNFIPSFQRPRVLGGFNSYIAWALGLLDPDANKAPFQMKRIVKTGEKSAGPLSITPELEQQLAADSIHRGQSAVDAAGFLDQIQRWLTIKDQPTLVSQSAKAELIRITFALRPCTEFGPDVPFATVSSFDSVAANDLKSAASRMGHEMLVLYDRNAGLYFLQSLRGDLDTIPNNLPVRQFGGKPFQSEIVDEYVAKLKNRDDVMALLSDMRSSGKWNFTTVGEGNTAPLQHIDLWDLGTRSRFFAKDGHGSPAIAAVFDITLQFEAMQDQKKDIHAVKILLKGSTDSLKDVEVFIRFEEPLSKKQLQNLHNSWSNVRRAQLVHWDDGRFTVIFENPITKIEPFVNGFKQLSGNQRAPITALQSFGKSQIMYPLFGPLEISTCDLGYTRAPVRVAYGSVKDLPLRVPLNRVAMEWGFDPALEKLGFPRDASGKHNALLNYRGLSIPLVRPSDEDFTKPELKTIAGLETVSENDWMTVLLGMHGRDLTEVLQIERIGSSASSPSNKRANKSVQIPAEKRKGEMYDGEAQHIEVVGRWFIFHCTFQNTNVFIVDSPLYGHRAFFFESAEHARSATLGFVSEEIRRSKWKTIPGCVGAMEHRNGWREELRDFIERLGLQ